MLISFNSKVYIIFKFISERTLIRAFKLLVSYSTTVAVYCEMGTIRISTFEVHSFRRQLVNILDTQTMEYFAHFKHSNKLLSSCCMG